MGATATCRSSTAAGSWESFPASISAASNWIAWMRKPVCGRGSDGRNQRTAEREKNEGDHLPRDADQSRGNFFCYRDFHQISDDKVTNLLGERRIQSSAIEPGG